MLVWRDANQVEADITILLKNTALIFPDTLEEDN